MDKQWFASQVLHARAMATGRHSMLKSFFSAAALASAVIAFSAPAAAQMERVPDRPAGEGEGPYDTLLIKDATMIDGTGAPPEGPVSILVEGNRIARILRGGADIPADRVIDASGMYILPGFVDTHGHNGDPSKAPQPSYGFKLWLTHGVTSVRGVGFGFGPDDPSLDQKRSQYDHRAASVRLHGSGRCLAERRSSHASAGPRMGALDSKPGL